MNCENRVSGCHGYCEDYKAFRKELDAKNKLKQDEYRKRAMIDGYCHEARSKNCKRKSDKVKYLRER